MASPILVRLSTLTAALAALALLPSPALADSSQLPVSCDTTTCTVQLGGGYIVQLAQVSSGVDICEGFAVECSATNGVFVGPDGGTVWLNGTEFLSTDELGLQGLVNYIETHVTPGCLMSTLNTLLYKEPPSCP
jgi:hypothetical protein